MKEIPYPTPSILFTAVELALQLGYEVNPKEESKLGKAVAKAYREANLGEPETTQRLIRGKFLTVKGYPAGISDVESAIHRYYQSSV